MSTHLISYFKHYRPELFIVLGDRRPLPQVEQTRLVSKGMVEIPEFSFKRMAEILPAANSQPCPILVGDRTPPGQSLARQQGDSHLDNLRRLCHPRHFTKLLDVKRPICQLLGVPIKLLGLLQFNFRPS